MTAADHIRRYPHARRSTIRFLTERDRKNAELEQYVKDQRRRQFIAKVKRVLWWRG